MKKCIRIIVFLFGVITIFFSFQELEFKNDIFALSKAPCCNNGQCTGLSCGTTSQFELISDCNTTLYQTCKDCLDYEAGTNQLCTPVGSNQYCLDNGVKYYGDGVWETRTITFNATSPSGGSYTMGGTGYTPVTSAAFKYLSTHTLYATNSFTGGIPPNTFSWKFDRWSFGGSNNPVSYQVTASATIYAIYKRVYDK